MSAELRVGLVGAGGIATRHLPGWLEQGADVAVFAATGAEALTARYGGTLARSVEEMLAACDIVDVATPTPVHRQYVDLALAAGKDVVCEKPIARTHDDAVAMVRAARRAGRQLHVAHVVRYFPQYAAMRDAVAAGRLGQVAVARFVRTVAAPTASPWFADVRQSGGVVLDLMIHDMDIARWVCGEVREVYATCATARDTGRLTGEGPGDGPPGGLVTVAHAVLTHASGAISHVNGVWGPATTTFATRFTVSGTGGMLSYDSAREDSLRVDVPDAGSGGGLLPDTSFIESPYTAELREFAGAIRGGPAPRVTAVDGVAALDIALAALESIDTGKPVAITPVSELNLDVNGAQL